MRTRNGKIARLPRNVRDELNERLEQSEQSPQLLDWLNALPEVKKALREDFDGAPITKQNLSEWRQGGFQEWLALQELWDGVRSVGDFTLDVDSDRDKVLADDVATVLAARYAVLLTRWNGEVDGKFEAKTRALNRICRSVVQLQRSMHQAKKDNDEFIRGLEEESQKLTEKLKKMKLDRIWAIQREPVVAELFGGGELGRKLAKYIVSVENDVPGAKLEITEEDLEKANRGKGTPAKPAKARKTNGKKANKPLPENEMDENEEEETSPGQSESVKACLPAMAIAAKEGLPAVAVAAKEGHSSTQINTD